MTKGLKGKRPRTALRCGTTVAWVARLREPSAAHDGHHTPRGTGREPSAAPAPDNSTKMEEHPVVPGEQLHADERGHPTEYDDCKHHNEELAGPASRRRDASSPNVRSAGAEYCRRHGTGNKDQWGEIYNNEHRTLSNTTRTRGRHSDEGNAKEKLGRITPPGSGRGNSEPEDEPAGVDRNAAAAMNNTRPDVHGDVTFHAGEE